MPSLVELVSQVYGYFFKTKISILKDKAFYVFLACIIQNAFSLMMTY